MRIVGILSCPCRLAVAMKLVADSIMFTLVELVYKCTIWSKICTKGLNKYAVLDSRTAMRMRTLISIPTLRLLSRQVMLAACIVVATSVFYQCNCSFVGHPATAQGEPIRLAQHEASSCCSSCTSVQQPEQQVLPCGSDVCEYCLTDIPENFTAPSLSVRPFHRQEQVALSIEQTVLRESERPAGHYCLIRAHTDYGPPPYIRLEVLRI